ncbi:DUF2071 domain-containing protein [Georgenia sp. MJ173]|uniref:YqjF family protein n=1 Tax=Georgenia sunbinii TaxID=3117728 RepID=UPI002F265CCA
MSRVPEHRVRVAVNAQHWQSLSFLHWPVAPAMMQRRLPAGLELDTFDGAAWVGVTPFLMRYLGTPTVPVALVPRFVEVNVRTYVRGPDGRDGVWFFSLECSRLPVVAGLRLLGLPYMYSRTALGRRGSTTRYASRRRCGGGRLAAEVRVGDPLTGPDALTTFLTGRWNAYSYAWGQLWRTPIEHEPWPLHHARASVEPTGLLLADSLPPLAAEPTAHFAPMVRVRIGAPRRSS